MLRFLAAMLLAGIALSGCSSSDGTTVRVTDNAFTPAALTVDIGTEVHFEVEGSNAHTVTVHKAGEPTTMHRHHEAVMEGDDVHVTFDEAGTYHVWCMNHGQMTSGMAMVVTVE